MSAPNGWKEKNAFAGMFSLYDTTHESESLVGLKTWLKS